MKYFKILISCAMIFVFISSLAFAQTGPYVRIIMISGQAEFLTAGQSNWQKLTKGYFLYSGDSVKTYEDSAVEIAFGEGDNNIVSIQPNSHVVIKLTGNEKIELIDGEIYALVESLPRGSTFEIRTPTAVCGARGTGWGANAHKNETTVSGYENNSYAKGFNKDGSIMEDNLTIPQGFETLVKLFQKPSKLMKISEKKMEMWNKWKDKILEFLRGRRNLERLNRNLTKIQGQKEKIEELHDRDRIDKRTESKGAGTGTSGRENGDTVPPNGE